MIECMILFEIYRDVLLSIGLDFMLKLVNCLCDVVVLLADECSIITKTLQKLIELKK